MPKRERYKGYELSIVINKKLKHSYLSITNEGSIKIKTPIDSKQFIYSFIDERELWIEKQLKKLECFTPLGSKQLHSVESIEKRVDYFSELMSLHYSQLKFRKMKRRWGSCSSLGVITLNKALFFVEERLLEYVIVHELAHLKHMNHSKVFHTLVAHYLPRANEYHEKLHQIKLS